MRSSHWLSTSLIGDPVRNGAGEPLGRISELIIEPATGRIDFAILTTDTSGSTESRFIAVPWAALGLMAGRDYVLLDMDKIVLGRAPSFGERDWPDFADPVWQSSLYNYYGVNYPEVNSSRVAVEPREYPSAQKRMSFWGRVFFFLSRNPRLGTSKS